MPHRPVIAPPGDPDFETGGSALRRLREANAGIDTDAGFRGPPPSIDPTFGRAVPNPDPGFAGGSRNVPGIVPPSAPLDDDSAQLRKFRDLLIKEFEREPEPLAPLRELSGGQRAILGLAAAFNPEFGRSFVAPLLQERINRPLQEKALRDSERDRRIRIGSQIISSLESERKNKQLLAERDRQFKLDEDKFIETRDRNKKTKEFIDARIDKLEREAQAPILKDPRILELKRKADIVQDKLKRLLSPVTGKVLKGNEAEARRLAQEEDLVLSQITALLNDLKVPQPEPEERGEPIPDPDAPVPEPEGQTLLETLFGF